MPRPIRWFAFIATVLLIGLATLTPFDVYAPPPAETELVNFRGLADAIANVLLFVPLGVTAALIFRGGIPVVAGALLSMGVELAQLGIPGRFSSALDVLFNSVGAAAGLVIVRKADIWLRPRGVWRGTLVVVSALPAIAAIGVGSFLFAPSVPHLDLYGQWTARFETMAHYSGEVLAAAVGGMSIGSHRADAPEELRRSLLAGDTISVTFRTGEPASRPAPIFSIYDGRRREVVMIAADSTTLLFRMRMRSLEARLSQPDIRVRDALTAESGSVSTARVWRERSAYCVSVDAARWCRLGFTVGDTWSLLYYPVPAAVRTPLSLAWLAALAFPLGFWARTPRPTAAALAALLVLLLAIPHSAGILPTPASQLAAAVIGLAVGYRVGRRTERAVSLNRPAAVRPD
ncbi:MAG TPA: VanZ family protein [Longimicrobiales bacterium]